MVTFDYIYKVLEEEATGGWTSGRTVNRSCFDLKNQAVGNAIQKRTGAYVEAQFWMSKKRKNLNFEFASKKEHTQLRERLAASLRTFIFSKEHPVWLKPSIGSTVCKVQILDKAEVEAKTIIKEYFRFLNNAIKEWSHIGLAELPAHASFVSESASKIKSESEAKYLSISRMTETALATVSGSNGQQVLRTMKNKELRLKKQELEDHIAALVNAQNGCCAISGLPLLFDGIEGDSQLLCSLDRIDSSGHYEAGNLQVVCRFVNRWKSDEEDAEFRRLFGVVRAVGKG